MKSCNCLKCGTENTLDGCPNCGGNGLKLTWWLEHPLLICKKCKKRYRYLSCDNCGCDVPVDKLNDKHEKFNEICKVLLIVVITLAVAGSILTFSLLRKGVFY